MNDRGEQTRAAVAALALALALPLHARAVEDGGPLTPSAWRYRQGVTVAQGGLSLIEVPFATAAVAAPDLRDLRLVTAAGGEVPYALVRPEAQTERMEEAKSFDTRLVAGRTVVTVELATGGGLTAVEALMLSTPARDFLKAARVEASEDGRTYREVAAGVPVFRLLSGAESLVIEVAGRWQSLRIELDDTASAPIPVTGVQIRRAPAAAAAAESLDVAIVERLGEYGRSRLMLRLPHRALDVREVIVRASDPLFTRRATLLLRSYRDGVVAETAIATGTIFRVSVEGHAAVARLTLPVGTRIDGVDVVLAIDDGDSPPLTVERVELVCVPARLRFYSDTSPLELWVGNPGAGRPRYDLESLAGRLKAAPTGATQLGELLESPDYIQPAALPEVPETGAPLDTGGWAYRVPLEITAAGVQQLELPPEVLAHAAPGFRDLRVVRGDRQVPFVRDPTGVTREFAPELRLVTAGVAAGHTRYALGLPFSGLPLSYLRARIDDPLFEREVRLVAEVTDARGAIRELVIGRSTWVRRSGVANEWQTVSFGQGGGTRGALYLDIDNGDNPPLTLRDVTLHYRTERLLFKARPGALGWLYYGNPQVPAPRYDIALVAGQLLDAEKVALTAGAGERLEASDPALPSAGRMWLLYAALAIAVVVFLAAIVRFLPAVGGAGAGGGDQ